MASNINNYTMHEWHWPVVIKDLKAIDVQHTYNSVFAMQSRIVVLHFNHAIDTTHYPRK